MTLHEAPRSLARYHGAYVTVSMSRSVTGFHESARDSARCHGCQVSEDLDLARQRYTPRVGWEAQERLW